MQLEYLQVLSKLSLFFLSAQYFTTAWLGMGMYCRTARTQVYFLLVAKLMKSPVCLSPDHSAQDKTRLSWGRSGPEEGIWCSGLPPPLWLTAVTSRRDTGIIVKQIYQICGSRFLVVVSFRSCVPCFWMALKINPSNALVRIYLNDWIFIVNMMLYDLKLHIRDPVWFIFISIHV